MSKKINFVTAALMGIAAVGIVTLAQKDSQETGGQTLPQLAASQMMGATPAVKAIVNEGGDCLSIHLRDGNLRACEDQPDWQSLPAEVDRGQYFRSSSLD